MDHRSIALVQRFELVVHGLSPWGFDGLDTGAARSCHPGAKFLPPDGMGTGITRRVEPNHGGTVKHLA